MSLEVIGIVTNFAEEPAMFPVSFPVSAPTVAVRKSLGVVGAAVLQPLLQVDLFMLQLVFLKPECLVAVSAGQRMALGVHLRVQVQP